MARFEILREVYSNTGLRENVVARRNTYQSAVEKADMQKRCDPSSLFCVVDNETALTVYTAQDRIPTEFAPMHPMLESFL